MLLCMETRAGGEFPCPSWVNSNATSKNFAKALGPRGRHGGFADYSRGLMLPIERKSVEPLAAHTDPLHVSAKHQSLHHLVAQLGHDPIAHTLKNRFVRPLRLGAKSRFYWIVDDS